MQPLWKTIRKFLKILRIELAYGPAIPLLEYFFEEYKNLIQKRFECTPMFIVAFVYNIQDTEITHHWMNGYKDDAVIYTQ